MPEHPTESCLIICEGQVLPSSQMFEQQAEICQKKKAQKRPRCQEDSAIPELILINFIDTDEIQTDDLLIVDFIVDDSSGRNYISLGIISTMIILVK